MTAKDPKRQFGSLKIEWVEAFVLSIELKKRTAAAAAMGVRQTDMSRYIRNLESWLGGGPRLLLLEHNMVPTLTPAGKAFLPVAQQVLDLLRDAQVTPAEPAPPAPKVSSHDIKWPKPPPTER